MSSPFETLRTMAANPKPHVGIPTQVGEPARAIHGSARWMNREDVAQAGLFGPEGVLLGKTLSEELLRFNGDGHVMVFAPTGAGKGIGFVQANLVDYRASMVVLDPKGENAIVSASHRQKMGQEVIVLDPFDKTGLGSTAYNPLGALTYASNEALGPMVEAIAGALIPTTEHEREPHWPLGAKKFVSFLMWFMIAHEPPEQRHLIRLFELAHRGREGIGRIARVMAEGRHPDPVVRRMCVALGNWFLGREAKEFSYFESQVLNNLGWIGDFVWAKVLASPPSEPLPLKRRPMTVYLVLPFNQIARYRPWLRVMVADLIASLYDTPGALKTPVLFMLDEAFAGLGQMESLFDAAAAVRSAGARLCFIYQDIQQVQKLYGRAWGSLIANSGVTLFWAANDLEAAQFISQVAGSQTVAVPGNPTGMPQPLIRPEQVLQLPGDEIIALFRSLPPARFSRLNVLTDPRFASELAPNTTYDAPLAMHAAPRVPLERSWVPVDVEQTSSRALSRADQIEAEELAALSKEFGVQVVKNSEGIYGYLDEQNRFVALEG